MASFFDVVGQVVRAKRRWVAFLMFVVRRKLLHR